MTAPRANRAASAAPPTLCFAVRACSLGRVLIAWTERGVCDVRFGDSDAHVVRSFSARFPGARLAGSEAPPWVSAVAEVVDTSRAAEVPLDLGGTAFQQRVWRELRRIPPGQRRSYSEIARAIGRPTASRAVARACATNPIAMLVPCHRVVRADGELSGYRWGRRRKEALLAREAKSVSH